MRYILLSLFVLCSVMCAGRTPRAELLGRFEPEGRAGFVAVDTAVSDGREMWLRAEAYRAFLEMRDSALAAGIDLRIVSATRNFERQRQIWEHKWDTTPGSARQRCLSILRYSSMPGTSRHHWGTDVDLCSVEDSVWQSPEYGPVLAWLEGNACRFGFFMPYTDDPARPGYHYEPWHWSYMPTAARMERDFRRLISYRHIWGFRGAESARLINIIDNYVFGIAAHEQPCPGGDDQNTRE